MSGGPARVVVVGLGNPLRGDDGVGLAVAAALSRLLEREPVEGVEVVTSERGGLDVLPLIAGAHCAILVDCLEGATPEPGRARWLSQEELNLPARLAGAHDIDLPGLLGMARLLGTPLPETVDVLGIEASPGPEIDDRLSPAVAARVESIAAFLHAHLRALPAL